MGKMNSILLLPLLFSSLFICCQDFNSLDLIRKRININRESINNQNEVRGSERYCIYHTYDNFVGRSLRIKFKE